MKAGIINLEKLYKFVKKNNEHYDQFKALKPEFMNECKRVVKSACVPQGPGFYLWGRYNSLGQWKNIYLGKSETGKTSSLAARLEEEIKDERCFFWRILDSDADIRKPVLKRKGSHRSRSLRKQGATHIIWVVVDGLRGDDFKQLENDLIEALNPNANRQRKQPAPTIQKQTIAVIEEFRRQVHSHRNEAYPLRLFERARAAASASLSST